jgi:hypothetical protein
MVATNKNGTTDAKNRNGGRTATARRPKPAPADAAKAAAAGDRRSPPRRPTPVKVGARAAAARIRDAAALSDVLDTRQRLRRLAREVARGDRDVQRITLIETALGECLDEAGGAPPRERWLICTAATWALAWLARTRRAGGSAGSLLERLVREARTGETACRSRDTHPAPFVLTLARLFADIEACRCLEAAATAALEEEIGRLVSTGGTVGLAGSTAVVERVVRWTAARDIARVTGSPPWNEATEALWAAAAAAAVRLLGRDGRIIAGPGLLPGCFSSPLLAALDDGTHPKVVRRTARHLAGGGKPRQARLMPRDLHDPAACVAIIRSGWGRRDLRLLVEYRDSLPRLEIAVGDRMLFDGAWGWAASRGGRPLDAEGPWTASCWESDGKASFLEITAPLAGGMQLERQLVVLPDDRIVMLADALVPRADSAPVRTAANGSDRQPAATDPDALGYRSALPLATGLETEPAAETREILGFDTAMRFMALPLALPEWRTPGRGSFSATDGGELVLEQAGARRLYAPVWLDLDPRRVGGPLTWRQLTVADTRLILPAHQAAGFRVQAGLEQWLVYRALDAARNRTLLGCNVSAEFLVGRLKRSGEVARRLEIQ